MNKYAAFAAVFLAAALVIAPPALQACPACTEMVNSSTEADDADNFPEAMNQSILLMLGVPFSSLFVVGFMIYRGVKQNEAYREGLPKPLAA